MILHDSFIHYIGYIIIGVSLALAIWTMLDATKREMEDATKWFLIVLILNIIGIIVYITQRPKMSTNEKEET